MKIEDLLKEVNKRKKTPTELLQEIQQITYDRKYGRKGEDGIDADEDEIIERILPIVLAQIPAPIKGEAGKDAVVDYNKIIREVLSQIPKPTNGKDAVVDYDSIFNKVSARIGEEISKINIPQIDYDKITTDVITLIESLEGDDKLDVLKLKNLDKLLEQAKDFEIDAKKIKGLQDLLPKNPPQMAGGSGATFLKSMRDIDLTGLSNGQVLKWNASERKWKPSADSDTQNLQQVTDNGRTTDNVIINTAAPTFTYTSGKLTGIAYSDGTSKALAYNGDDTLNTLTITKSGESTIVKTFNWSGGVLQSITIS